MNMTASVDSFDKFKLFRIIHESTSAKGYFPQIEVIPAGCRAGERGTHVLVFSDIKRKVLQ